MLVHASFDIADDTLLLYRIAMQVQSPSQLDFCDSENYFQAAPWRLLLIIPALECGKILLTDIDNQHLALVV